MKRFRLALVGVAVVALFGGGYAAGQSGKGNTASQQQEEKRFLKQHDWEIAVSKQEAAAQFHFMMIHRQQSLPADPVNSPGRQERLRETANADNDVARLYYQAVKDPDLREQSFVHILAEHYRGRANDTSDNAMLKDDSPFRLQLLMAAQNQRIIELLEKQAASGKK